MSRHALASSLAAIALLHTQCVGASTPNVAAAAPPPPGLSVNFAADFSSYSVVKGDKTLFTADGGVAVFCDGVWHSQAAKTLVLGTHLAVTGSHPSLGKYTGIALTWTTASKTTVITTAKTYPPDTVTFEYTFPNGANGTSLVQHQNKTDSNQEVIVNFPAFTNWTLPGTVSWAGSFVGAHQGDMTSGPQGGPTVFFDPADVALDDVVVGSALDNFKDSSAGPGHTYDGVTKAWVPGTSGTITSLPKGFTHTFVLNAGAKSGITAAIAEWGMLLQRYYKAYKVPDVTLSNIGYQTDNGAYYVFCRVPGNNCSKQLIDVVASLKADGVPMGYLSFQGAGASSVDSSLALGDGSGGRTGAPWCINTWGPDLPGHGPFPMPLPDFQKALDVPLQLYAPYFCDGSTYFNRVDPSSNWSSFSSDTNLPGCHSYGFQDVVSNQSLEFYRWFFKKGKAVGMASFEPDFMNQNYNCVAEFVESATNAREWQMGMATAALEEELAVQWCYATPTDVLASLEMPAVTNFRTSNDFCYGHSWDIGVSSLIVWAAGAFPSKDTLWTSDNGKFPVPGCSWSADHETPAAALHVAIALMSTGPVGISDMLGGTNTTLIKRTITSNGTLLKPDKAITAIDAMLMQSGRTPAARAAPNGFVWSTYSTSMQRQYGTWGTPNAWYFVSFKMTAPYPVNRAEFFPPLKAQKLVSRPYREGAGCVNGSAATTCVTAETATAVFSAPLSDLSNVTGGTDYAPEVTTVWPVCASGFTFLGDLSKYVAASSQRFKAITCTTSGVSAVVVGTAGEPVTVTVLTAAKLVRVVDVVIPASGSLPMTF